MNTILITGTTGFVGSALTRVLRPRHRVIELNRTVAPGAADSIAWDFRSPLPLELPSHLDVVIHAAAVTSDFAADCFAVNTAATMQLLEYTRAAGGTTFVYLSTGSVYGSSARPHQEQHPLDPQGAYTCSKAAGEFGVRAYQTYFRTLTLRLFHPYGPQQRCERLVPRLIERIASGNPIPIKGSAGSVVNPLYIDDLTRWVSRLLECEATGTYNLAGTERTSIRELADQIGSLLDVPVHFEQIEGSPLDVIGDATEVYRATGQLPKWTLTAALTKIIHHSLKATPAGANVHE